MNQSSEPTPKAKHPGFGWVALLGWIASMTFSTSLFAGGALWFAHSERTTILNQTVATFAAPYKINVGSIDFDADGRISLDSVSLHDPADEKTTIELGRAGWDWDTRSLVDSRFGKFDIDAPKIRIGPKTFAAWMHSENSSSPDQPPAPPLLDSLVLSLQKIGIRSGSLELEADGYPTITFDFEYLGDEIGFAEGKLSAIDQKLVIRNFEAIIHSASAPPSSLRFVQAAAEFHADGDPATLDITSLELTGLDVQITPAAGEWVKSRSPSPIDSSANSATPLISRINLDHLAIPDALVAITGFDTATPALPECVSTIDFDLDTLTVDLEQNSFSVGNQSVALSDLDLRFHSIPGHVVAREIATTVTGLTPSGATVGSLIAAGADIHLTEDFIDCFLALQGESTPPDSPAASLPEFTIQSIQIPDARIATSAFTGLPDASLELSTVLPSWYVGGTNGFTLSDQPHQITLSNVAFINGETPTPIASIEKIDAEFTPSVFDQSRRFDRLAITSPHFHLTPENFSPLLDQASKTVPITTDTEPTAAPGATSPPLWEGIVIRDFSIAGGRFEIEERTISGVPAVEFDFHADTTSPDGVPTYTIPFTGIATTLQSFQEAPFSTTRALTLTLNTDDLWNQHTFTEVDFDGMTGVMAQELVDAVAGLTEEPIQSPSPAPPPQSPDQAGPPAPPITAPEEVAPKKADPKSVAAEPDSPEKKKPWKIGRLRIRNSEVTLRGVAPGLPPVTIGIKADIEGVPISPEAFLGDLREHQVEIDRIRIPSFYNPLVNVAILENIWIDFTLDGIAKQTIDKVVIGAPSIYVGEHLFWYVDYYRKFLDAGTAEAPADEADEDPAPVPPPDAMPEKQEADPDSSDTDPVGTPDDEVEIEIEAPEVDSAPTPGWSVTRLQALNGKLIIAPKGSPVPGFPHPFPFNCDTTLASGELHADLTIPDGTYELEDIKLRIGEVSGKVYFNLPVKSLDNNLTQTFTAKQLRFHQMEAEEVSISVTYDSYGIYAEFWCAMYDGDVNGQFNVYLDEQYSWDAWITGTSISTGPLTTVLTPEYFRMDGPIDFSVVANGNASELYQADGKLEGKDKGKMKIQALNDAISNLPGDWSALETKVTTIGLETLRDFDYDSVDGSFRLFGREGTLDLGLYGPFGSRVFEVNVHDHRNPTLDPDLLDITPPKKRKPTPVEDPDIEPAQ